MRWTNIRNLNLEVKFGMLNVAFKLFVHEYIVRWFFSCALIDLNRFTRLEFSDSEIILV